MPFTAPTLLEAKTALASRLNDPDMVRWVDAELTLYIREALRVWNAWTAHWRESGTFTSVMDQAFYELPTELAALRVQDVTNWDLVTEIQYALLEDASDPAVWNGTDQFTLAQVSGAIQRRRDQFLRETGAVLTHSETLYAAPPGSGRITLSEDVTIVRRAAWRVTATGLLLPLRRNDLWGANKFSPGWNESARPPGQYSVSETPPLEFQVIPPTAASGTLDLVSVNKGDALDEAVATPLGIPNDFAWVVKYGALADLLQGDGLALDPGRASYCEQRWQQGLDAAKSAPVVLGARIDDVVVQVGSLADADKYSPTWQLLGGIPRQIILAGQNLVASWPPPGGTGGPWEFTLDLVRNAPVPNSDSDILQISGDVYDSILDYAQHAALVKEGPGQTELAIALLDRVTRAAGIELRIQQASQPERAPLMGQTRQDERSSARELDPVQVP